MPELPEVEIVTQGLIKIVGSEVSFSKISFLRENIRNPLPEKLAKALRGQPIERIYRRAKYIIIETPRFRVISHLGMTGSWRLSSAAPGLHDHVLIELSDGQRLIYRDPRRFGIFDIVKLEQFASDRRFTHLGPEPFDEAQFNSEYLHRLSRNKTAPVKTFIMDQRVVVGVGNIYASEALFLAGISPLVQAKNVSKERYKLLVAAIRKVLKKAIKNGGSTINDFVGADGQGGYFQTTFNVYGRDGEPCRKCGTLVKIRFLAGRSTFWCVKCQK